MAERDLVVRFIGDERDLQRSFQNQERQATQFQRRMRDINGRTQLAGQGLRGALSQTGGAGGFLFGSAAFVGASLTTAAIAKSVSAASDLNEEISKSEQIFGDSAKAVQDWSKTTASSIGISQTAALQATGIFGNLFTTVGLGPEKNAELSKSLVQLAADLASFNNASPQEALDALRSGLIGEAEPLRRFGVLLSEARVQQRAMGDTGKTTTSALTDQEKLLARYEIIMQDTTKAQGDFARTSEGLANQTRIAKAQLNDLAANLGKTFLPAVNLSLHAVNGLLGEFHQASIVDQLTVKIAKNAEGMKNALPTLEAYRAKIAEIKGEDDALVTAIDNVIAAQVRQRDEAAQAARESGRANESGRGAAPTPAELAGATAANIAAANKRQAAQNAASAKAFSEHLAGLGLKLDKARLTGDTANDLAVLREIEDSIRRRIRVEGDTFALEQQLTAVRTQIATLEGQRATDAANAARDAFDNIIAALDLKLQAAQRTVNLDDDIRVLRQIQDAIRKRIQEEGKTAELAQQLAENRQEIADAVRGRRTQRQFLALGLTAEGDERTQSQSVLRRRANTLEDRVKGTVLDTAATRRELDRIQAVLSGKFGEVGRNVRQAIQAMLDEIGNALKGGSSSGLPRTKFRVANFSDISNLFPDLSDDDQIRLKQILARRGPGGTIAQGSRTGGAFGISPAEHGQGRIDLHVHVELDGKEIANVTVNETTKKGNRKSGTRSGVRPGPRGN